MYLGLSERYNSTLIRFQVISDERHKFPENI